jgi:hypothetical protein
VTVPAASPRTPGKNKLSPRAIKRALQLEAAGQSTRSISATLAAEGLGAVGHSSVARMLARQQQAAAAGPTAPQAAPPPAEEIDEAGEVFDVETAPLDVMRRRLAGVRALIDKLEPAVLAQTYPAPQWASLCVLETRIAARLAELEPPPPPDPEQDPHNFKAREMVIAHVMSTIEAVKVRAGLLCSRCRAEVAERHANTGGAS